jgi:uncharacterized membrane protein
MIVGASQCFYRLLSKVQFMPDSDLWLLIPRPVRRVPADIGAVVVLVLLTFIAVSLPIVKTSPLRILLGVPFVLFLPGYVIVASLFPEASDEVSEPDSDDASKKDFLLSRTERGITGLVRLVLSVGLSLAIVPLIGILLVVTSWGIRLRSLLFCIGGLTLFMAVVATRRRWQLPAGERFLLPYRSWGTSIKEEVFTFNSRTQLALNIALVLSVIVAIWSVGFAVTGPERNDSFSSFYLLKQNENGKLVADDYPSNFTQGESKPLYIGVENHEHQSINYTVVVRLERVSNSNGTTNVIESRELQRYHPSVRANGTWRVKQQVTPRMSGKHLRLRYLLYTGNTPSSSTETAYRELHLWINVSKRSE